MVSPIASFPRRIAQLGTQGAKKSPQLLPPMVGIQTLRTPEDRDIVVSETDLLAGQTEHSMNRAELLINSAKAPAEYKSTAAAMKGIGDGLNDPSVAKDPGWFMQSLGWVGEKLDPLKYLDIPLELAAEGIFDPIAAVTGRDLSWVRGTAERELYEGWKGLFRDADADATGWREVMARMDIAAEAFEKRPLWAQLAGAGIQAAVSFGAAGYAKGLRVGAKIAFEQQYRGSKRFIKLSEFRRVSEEIAGGSRSAREVMIGPMRTAAIKGNAARAGAMLFDPWEAGFHAIKYPVKYSYKGGKAILGPLFKKPNLSEDAVDDEVIEQLAASQDAGSRGAEELKDPREELERRMSEENVELIPKAAEIDVSGHGILPPTTIEDRIADITSGNTRHRYALFSQGELGNIHKGDEVDEALITPSREWEGPIHPDTNPIFFEQQEYRLQPLMQRGNQIRDVVRRLVTMGMEAEAGSVEQIGLLNRALVFQLGLSVGSRKGHLYATTAKALWGGKHRYSGAFKGGDTRGLIDTNRIDYYDDATKPLESPSMRNNVFDTGESAAIGTVLTNAIEQWSKNNADIITASGKKFNENQPLDWIDDADEIFSFNPEDVMRLETGNVFTRAKVLKVADKVEDGVDNLGWAMTGLDDTIAEIKNPEWWTERGQNLVTAPNGMDLGIIRIGEDGAEEAIGMLTNYGRLFRQQRATEMLFEDYSIDTIAYQLNHQSEDVSAIYMRGIGYLGKGSQRYDNAKLFTEFQDELNADPLNEAVREQFKADWMSDVERGKTAKGMKKGDAEEMARLWWLSEKFQTTDSGRKILDTIIEKKFSHLQIALDAHPSFMGGDFARMSTDSVEQYRLIKRGIETRAMAEAAQILAELQGHARKMKRVVNHNYNTKAGVTRAERYDGWAIKGSMDKPGLLNRAGYYIRPGDGELVWAGDTPNAVVKAGWTAKREKLRDALGFTGEEYKNLFGAEAVNGDRNWLDWAKNLQSEVGDYDTLVTTAKEFKFAGHKIKLAEALIDQVDAMGYVLAERWNRLGGAEGFALRRTIGGGIFNDLFDNLKNVAWSTEAQDIVKPGRNFFTSGQHAYNEAKRKLNGMIIHNQAIEGFWKSRRTVEDFDPEIGPGMGQPIPEPKLIQPRDRTEWDEDFLNRFPLRGNDGQNLTEWLKDHNIRTAFGIVNLKAGMDAKAVRKGLTTLASEDGIPRIFGDSFIEYAKLYPDRVDHFLDKLADRMVANPDLWSFGAMLDAHAYVDVARRIGMRAIKRKPRGAAGLVHMEGGQTTAQLIGAPVQSVPDRIRNIKPILGEAFQIWLNKDNAFHRRLIKLPVSFLGSIVQGGQAGIAHPITRAISARMGGYYQADEAAQITQGVILGKLKNLGVYTESLDAVGMETLAAEGIADSGLQYFARANGEGVGIELDTIENIMEFEASEDAINFYRKFAAKGGDLEDATDTTRIQGGIFTVLKSRLGKDVAEAEKNLLQVDVVLERIAPEHWHKYFGTEDIGKPGADNYVKGTKDDYTPGGATYNELIYIKDMVWEMDKYMKDVYNVDIPRRLLEGSKKPGAADIDYMQDFIPRMYRTFVRNNAKSNNEVGVLKSDAGRHFQARKQSEKDIANVISGVYNRRSNTYAGFNMASDYLLEPLENRIGKYVGEMHKLGIDEQTKRWLMAETAPKGKVALAAIRVQQKALHSMDRLARDKFNGETIPSGDDIIFVEENLESKIFNRGEFEQAEPMTKARMDEIHEQTKLERIEIEKKANFVKLGNHVGSGHEWLQNADITLKGFEANEVKKYLEIHHNVLANPLKWVGIALKHPSEVIRYWKSGLDAGAPMIHGFNSLVRSPIGLKSFDFKSQKAWLEGVALMSRFIITPEYHDKWIFENAGDMAEASRHMRMGRPEQLVAMDSATMEHVKRWAYKHVPLAEQVQFLKRMETGFTGYLDVIRTLMYKAEKETVVNEVDRLAQAASKAGRAWDAAKIEEVKNDKLHELGAVLNKMTGTYDPSMVQQTPFQSLLENSLLFFAPMYRRAVFGIIGDLMKGVQHQEWGIRQEQAFRQLSGVVVAGAMMGVLAEATGNNKRGFIFDEEGELGRGEGALDMTHRFGKFNVDGMQIGVGTAWWTAFRMASDIAMNQAKGGPDRDTDEHWSNHWAITMLGRRGRSQLAPGAALATDIFSGRTFIGEPLRDTDESTAVMTIQHMGRAVIPFWLDGALQQGIKPGTGMAMGMAGEFFGLQSYESSSWDRFNEAKQYELMVTEVPKLKNWRERRQATGQSTSFVYLPKTFQRDLLDSTDALRLMKEDHEKEYGPMRTGSAEVISNFMTDLNQFKLGSSQRLAQVSQMVERNEVDYTTLQKVISTENSKIRDFRFHLYDKYPEVKDFFLELKDTKADRESTFIGDIVYDAYNDEKNNPALEEKDGSWNYDKMNQNLARFWSMPENYAHKEYVMNRSNEWLASLPTIKEFDNAKDYFRTVGYTNIEDKIFPRGSYMNTKATYWLSMHVDERENLKLEDPDYKEIERKLRDARRSMAASNRLLDYYLVKFYNNNPRHKDNTGLKERIRSERRLQRVKTADADLFEISASGRITVNWNKNL